MDSRRIKFKRSTVFKIYLTTLITILSNEDKINEAINWRALIYTSTPEGQNKVTLSDVKDQFDELGHLKSSNTLIYPDKERSDLERQYVFNESNTLSEWEKIILQSAYFKAAQDTHTFFLENNFLTSMKNGHRIQQWLDDVKIMIKNNLSSETLGFNPPNSFQPKEEMIEELNTLKNHIPQLIKLIYSNNTILSAHRRDNIPNFFKPKKSSKKALEAVSNFIKKYSDKDRNDALKTQLPE